jgi:four helix bundle protein
MNPRQEYSFEKLRVWQAARDLSKAVYLTTAKFPQREMYGLVSQCNRAVVSVAANLAEGSSRQSGQDQAHFSEIAYGSLMELACLLILASDTGILHSEAEQILRRSIDSTSQPPSFDLERQDRNLRLHD